MYRRLTIATVIAALWSGPALADDDAGCKLRMDSSSSQWKIDDVDLFSTDVASGSFDLYLENEGSAPCAVRLRVDTQGAPFGLASSGGRRFGYSIFDKESGADLTPRNGQSLRRTRGIIVVPAHGQAIARLDVAVPITFSTDGNYGQQLRIEAEGDDDSASALRVVNLAVDVKSSASMALSGQFTRVGSNADIDLGEIEPGVVRTPVILHVRSTRAYRIDSKSENGGKLILPGTAWQIPYQMTIGSTTLNPDGGFYLSTPGNTRRVDNLAMGFAINGGSNVEAGRYSDIITLSIGMN